MAQTPQSRPGRKPRAPADIDLTAKEIRNEAAISAGTPSIAPVPEPVEPVAMKEAAAAFTIPPADATQPDAPQPATDATQHPPAAEATAPSEPVSPEAETAKARPVSHRSSRLIFKAIAAGAIAGAAFGTLAALFVPVLKGRPKIIDLTPVETRVAALEKRDVSPDASRLQALTDQIADLQRQLATQRDALAETGKTIASVRQTATAGISSEIAPLAARLQGLEQSGQALASKVSGVASGQSTSVAASLLAATQALAASFERGTSLQPELKAVEAISGNGDRLVGLRPYATTGAPTIRALTEQFRALRPVLLAAETPPASNGILDRLAASASSIVKVRPVGAQAGTDTISVVSRIEAALQRGDLDLVLKEAAGLPEKPAQAAASWLKDVAARQNAAAALRGLENDALQVLSAGSR